jgi:hypothetical protein
MKQYLKITLIEANDIADGGTRSTKEVTDHPEMQTIVVNTITGEWDFTDNYTKDQSSKGCNTSSEDKELKRFCIDRSINLAHIGLVESKDIIEEAKKFYSYITE